MVGRPSIPIAIGTRFGRLVTTGEGGLDTLKRQWILPVLCDCGTTKDIRKTTLLRGEAQSCGCLRSEVNRRPNPKKGDGSRRHEQSNTRLHNIWKLIRQRCSNPKNDHYHLYGGRGISRCAEWDRFEAFRDWALAHGYADDLSIDRIDNDGDYEPGNCRWTDRQTQADNSTRPTMVTAFGETKSVNAWNQDPRCFSRAAFYRRTEAGIPLLSALFKEPYASTLDDRVRVE